MSIFNILKKPSESDKIFKEKFRFLNNVKYKPLGRVLTDREIKKFESINNITLPDDYKYFLTHIGNGIKTPKIYNLFPKNPRFAYRFFKGIDRKALNKPNKMLSQEFLFDEPFSTGEGLKPTDWFSDCSNPNLTHDELCDNCKNIYNCPFTYSNVFEKSDEYPYYRGVLPICNAGCTYQYFLVLTGRHSGEVWIDNDRVDFSPAKSDFVEFLNWATKSSFI